MDPALGQSALGGGEPVAYRWLHGMRVTLAHAPCVAPGYVWLRTRPTRILGGPCVPAEAWRVNRVRGVPYATEGQMTQSTMS